MICADCGAEFKGVCRACQARRTRIGILLHQRRFLQTWLAGGIDLRVKVLDGVIHLELFDDRWHGYCGVEMFKETRRSFIKQPPPDLCPECSKIFDEQLTKAKEGL